MSVMKQKRLKQKREAILAEAEKVLIKYGKNATMGDIAAALDMDKSSLYYYFKGIPEILNTILDKEYYNFDQEIMKLRQENRSHTEILKQMAKLILEFYHHNLEILLIILTRIFPLLMDPEAKEESTAINNYMDSYRLANDLMLEEIKLGLENGEFRTGFSPEMVLQTLRGAIFGVCAVWKKEKPPLEAIPGIVDQLITMYI